MVTCDYVSLTSYRNDVDDESRSHAAGSWTGLGWMALAAQQACGGIHHLSAQAYRGVSICYGIESGLLSHYHECVSVNTA